MRQTKLLLIAALSLFGSVVNAQDTYLKPGQNRPTEMWTPLANTSNTYYGIILPVASPTNFGVQIDTVTNASTITLQVASLKAGKVAIDTFTPSPLVGGGRIKMTASVWKCTGTGTVVLTFVSGTTPDKMTQISGSTVYTLNPTSLTVPVITTYVGDKYDRYYGYTLTGVGTQSASTQGSIYYIKSNYITWTGN